MIKARAGTITGAPDALQATDQSNRTAPSAENERIKRPFDSILTGPSCQEFVEFSTGAGDIPQGFGQLSAYVHYSATSCKVGA